MNISKAVRQCNVHMRDKTTCTQQGRQRHPALQVPGASILNDKPSTRLLFTRPQVQDEGGSGLPECVCCIR